MCNWICTEFCGTSSFPLSFVHWTAIPVDFHLGSLQHSTPPPSPKQSENIPKYCTVLFTGPQTRNGSLSTFSHPMEQKLMELGSGCHGEMEKQGTEKGNSPCRAQRWNAGLWAAAGGTGHQCHWLSKSKNRTILRQVPKQGAIYFLGTISSYASRLLLYPLYGQ